MFDISPSTVRRRAGEDAKEEQYCERKKSVLFRPHAKRNKDGMERYEKHPFRWQRHVLYGIWQKPLSESRGSRSTVLPERSGFLFRSAGQPSDALQIRSLIVSVRSRRIFNPDRTTPHQYISSEYSLKLKKNAGSRNDAIKKS